MKVRLIKSAEFEFNESKYTSLPFDVFKSLVGDSGDVSSEPLCDVVVFEDREDFIKNANHYNFDVEKPVSVSSKGQIFVFLSESEPESDAK